MGLSARLCGVKSVCANQNAGWELEREGAAMADWLLTSLQLKLIKFGARIVRHARAITLQLAEIAVTGAVGRAILAAIRRLRAPPPCALPRSTPNLGETSSTSVPAALRSNTAG